MISSLPDELWLQILSYLEPQDLWLNTRKVSKQLRSCSEDVVENNVINNFTISMSVNLGAGSRARWYDVKGSITLCFTSMSKHNPQYALFDKVFIYPESCRQRTWERWNQICSAGVGDDVMWRVQLCRNYSDEAATTGGDMRAVKLQNLIISEEHGAWCDWRELMGAYFDHAARVARNHIRT